MLLRHGWMNGYVPFMRHWGMEWSTGRSHKYMPSGWGPTDLDGTELNIPERQTQKPSLGLEVEEFKHSVRDVELS